MSGEIWTLADFIGKKVKAGNDLRGLWKLEKPLSSPCIPGTSHSSHLVHSTRVYGAFLIQNILPDMYKQNLTNEHIGTSGFFAEINMMQKLGFNNEWAFCNSERFYFF